VQESADIVRTLRDRNNFDRPVFGANNRVGTDRPEQHRIAREVFAFVAHARYASEGFECVKQSSYPSVGRIDVVGGDVFPDFIKIEIGVNAEDIDRSCV
jgi:hypothetical protein